MGAHTHGPAWHRARGALFFTTPLGEGALHRMDAPGSAVRVWQGSSAQGSAPIGNAVLVGGDLVTVEGKRIVRSAVSIEAGLAAPMVVATTYPGHVEPMPFDALDDVAARRDGTLYVTDPGDFAMPSANRVYRVSPAGEVSVVAQFEDLPRPRGIALSPDERTLYVGFAEPAVGTTPAARPSTPTGRWGRPSSSCRSPPPTRAPTASRSTRRAASTLPRRSAWRCSRATARGSA